ncbi:hypothetical protein GSY69_09170 [Brevibacterium sp. 5221]|uniref:Tubulin-like protein n=1 Tax=Brevibacterium rongguiense TaxID=2695267 RepID=A0A6N9H9F6_9MICO|nr:tubulin-like doman-containing protein [Brevibacterium rongguiense]MYM20132.1 hypothetical protein [Brevibacterium rongguiense]
MYKFLVVGCGGSGGETLARIMDQLKSELMPLGISELPEGWQFVHVDVPVVPDTNIPGVGSVRDQGGTYIGTAPSSGSYTVLDTAVSQKLAQQGELAEFVTWAPRRPESVTTPLHNGAGQMRGVGRVITLNRAVDVYEGLQRAVNKLNTTQATADMQRIAREVPGSGGFDPESTPMVFVVSSMAGGAGASMALDVCRLLGQVQGISPNDTCVYMYTSDIFPDRLEGVRPNALGMLGEIVAAQTAASEEHDVRILDALGQRIDQSGAPSFARVFPVSKFQGLERTTFGDGSQAGLYRGLARGLAALMISGKASANFRAYDLTNREELSPNRSFLGWGMEGANRLSWGTFGFGSLSMGRDRYRHYSSQRLARSAVDRLREGHLQPGNSAGSAQQLERLVDSQWSYFLDQLGLPQPQEASNVPAAGGWVTRTIDRGQADAWARDVIGRFNVPGELPRAQGQTGANWLAAAGNYLRAVQPRLMGSAESIVQSWAFDWAKRFERSLLGAVTAAASQFGLPYARAMLTRLGDYLAGQVVPRLTELSRTPPPDIARIPQHIEAQAGATKGAIVQGQAIEQNLLANLQQGLVEAEFVTGSDFVGRILAGVPSDVIAPLQKVIEEAISGLDIAVTETSRTVGLANVETDVYTAWPSDEDQLVPERFATAHNEVLLTPAAQFADLYRGHLPAAIPGVDDGRIEWDNARTRASGHVISGQWPVAQGSSAPGGLFHTMSEWMPSVFRRHPSSGEPLTPAVARYSLHVGPGDLRRRALEFVNRRNEAFDSYCALSLEDFVLGNDGAAPHELAQRKTDLETKFRETLTRGLPLGSVHPDVVSRIHSSAVRYQYKFSSIPFAAAPDLVDRLREVLTNQQSVDAQTVDIFDGSLTQGQPAAGITHVDLFGSFGNLSPIAFDGVLKPVSTRWSQLTSGGQRRDFWTYRRARPLPASLPMAAVERRALIGGWYVAQLTGQLEIPDRRNLGRPVQVYDRVENTWVPFPNPLLTPPSEFYGETFDWLPAVMESVLIAIANAHQSPVLSSLKPYQVLRSIFDASEEEPAAGLQIRAAEDLLSHWLATGQTPSGAPSRAAADTLEERYEKAAKFIETVHGFAAGMLGSGTTGRSAVAVGSRSEGAKTPFFCDLVPDIVAVTDELAVALQRARDDAAQASTASSPSSPPEELGAF